MNPTDDTHTHLTRPPADEPALTPTGPVAPATAPAPAPRSSSGPPGAGAPAPPGLLARVPAPARGKTLTGDPFPQNAHKLVDDPIAVAVLAAVRALEPGKQFLVLSQLQRDLAHDELAGGPQATRLMNAVRSLNEAYGVLLAEHLEAGGDPGAELQLSERAYVRLRSSRRDHGWAAESTIRRVVAGSWNDGLRRAHLPTVDEADAVFIDQGPQFTWEEVRDCVSDCIVAMRAALPDGAPEPDPGLHEVLSWCRRPDIQAGPKRRQKSPSPFKRYGGFLAVKHAVLTDGAPPNGGRRGAPSRTLRPRSALGLGVKDFREAIHRVRERLGRVPRAGEFQRLRQDIIDEQEGVDLQLQPFASYPVIQRYYGCWDAALIDAGLPPFKAVTVNPVTGRPQQSGPRNEILDEDILAGIREAREVTGEPFNSKSYVAYRNQQGPTSRHGRRLAVYAVVWKRYGSWTEAMKAAFPEETDS